MSCKLLGLFNLCDFFFFFENKVCKFYQSTNILSSVTSCFTLHGRSDQKCGQGIHLAALANLSATAFPFLFTWTKLADAKFRAIVLTSSIMRPKELKQGRAKLRAFIIVSESPSNTTSLKPGFKVKTTADLQAKASTSSTVIGRVSLA